MSTYLGKSLAAYTHKVRRDARSVNAYCLTLVATTLFHRQVLV